MENINNSDEITKPTWENFPAQFYQHLSPSFLKEALFQVIKKEPPGTPLLLINHENRYLSLSNETHYIFLLPRVTREVILEVKQEMQYIPSRKKIAVQLEQQEDFSMFKDQCSVSVMQIKQQAMQNGVPEKNLFLALLEELLE